MRLPSGCPLSGPAFRLRRLQSRSTMCPTRPTHRVVEAEVLVSEVEVLPQVVVVHMPHSSKKNIVRTK